MKFKDFINESEYDISRSSRTKTIIDNILNSFKGKDTIPMSEWSNLKKAGSVYIENEASKIKDVYLAVDYDMRHEHTLETKELDEIYYMDIPLHNFESKMKIFNSNYNKKYSKEWMNRVIDVANKFFVDNLKIVQDINYWRDKAVKKVPGEAKAKKQAEVMRILSTNKDVKDIVEKIAEEFRPEIIDSYSKWKTRVVLLNSENNKVLIDSRSNLRNIMGSYIESAVYSLKDFKKIPEGMKSYTTYNLKSDYKSIIKKESEENAENIIQEFISKLVMKLNSIISKKGNLKEAKKVGTLHSNEISVEFKDKSKFIVRSKIVFVTNSNGTSFSRYPTTFHDVYLSDGTKMGEVSELTMISKFAEDK